MPNCEIVYICVPTPELSDGSCDTRIVEDVMDGLINSHSYGGIIA